MASRWRFPVRASSSPLRVGLALGVVGVLLATTTAFAGSASGIDVQLPAAPATFSISGTITTTGGAPIVSAFVNATGPAGSGFAITDGTGAYTVEGLDAGSYSLRISPPFGANLQTGYYLNSGANHFTAAAGSATKVSVGPDKANIDVRLPAGFRISGKITSTAGKAISGAFVFASGPNFAGFASTSSTGAYSLVGLSPGSYTIRVSPPNGTSYLTGYYTTANANHFTIAAGSAKKLAVGPSKTGVNIKLPTGFSISGKILTSGGAPISGAFVFARSSTYSGGATTSATGVFSIKGLAAGTYKLQILSPGNSAYLGGYYTSSGASHYTAAAASASGLKVGPNKTGINVKLPLGFTISGTITDEASTPIQGVVVGANAKSATTDAAGHYTIRGLAKGSYRLSLTPPDGQNFQTGWWASGPADHFAAARASASLVAVGPSKANVNAKLPAGLTISGTITGLPGPVNLAFAGVTATDANMTASATTAADGTYTISGLSPGSYVVHVDPGFGGLYVAGYYDNGAAGNYTAMAGSATPVAVSP